MSLRKRFWATMSNFQMMAVAPGDLLVALGRVRAKPHGREGRLDHVRRPKVVPVRLGEAVEGDHPLPVPPQDLDRLGEGSSEALGKAPAESLTFGPALGIGNLAEEHPRLALKPSGNLVEHVEDSVASTSALRSQDTSHVAPPRHPSAHQQL